MAKNVDLKKEFFGIFQKAAKKAERAHKLATSMSKDVNALKTLDDLITKRTKVTIAVQLLENQSTWGDDKPKTVAGLSMTTHAKVDEGKGFSTEQRRAILKRIFEEMLEFKREELTAKYGSIEDILSKIT